MPKTLPNISVNRIRAINSEAFDSADTQSLGNLTDAERQRLGRAIFIVPYVSVPMFCGEEAIQELLDNLNGHPDVCEAVHGQWDEFLQHFRELLDRHADWYNTVRRIKGERYSKKSAIAVCLMVIINAWASGRLEYLRQCQHCGKSFLAKRTTEVFHSPDCRIAFHYEVESQTKEYKARKAEEARKRRKDEKTRNLKKL